MSVRVSERAGREGGGAHPSGIIVLDRLPPEPRPQVQAFVWCKRRENGLAFPDANRKRPTPAALMVGLATELNGNG